MTHHYSRLSIGLVAAALMTTAPVLATQPPTNVNSATSISVISDADLDRLLAPIALYPDTLLTHILIASTYPLDIVAAHRWRQANLHLSSEQLEHALRAEPWEPSVKALVPFTDILALMADDLTWLGTIGETVSADQRWVLDRVQSLRRYAHKQGSLRSNNYLEVSQQHQVIVINPRQHTRLYVPFYDTRTIFGHWHHRIQPLYWRYPSHARHYAGINWSIGFSLSSGFYFGGIHWQDRYVAISRAPVRHWRSATKRVNSKTYQRWQPRQRHTGSSRRVITRERQTAAPQVASRTISGHKVYSAKQTRPQTSSRSATPRHRAATVSKAPRQALPIKPRQKVRQIPPTTATQQMKTTTRSGKRLSTTPRGNKHNSTRPGQTRTTRSKVVKQPAKQRR